MPTPSKFPSNLGASFKSPSDKSSSASFVFAAIGCCIFICFASIDVPSMARASFGAIAMARLSVSTIWFITSRCWFSVTTTTYWITVASASANKRRRDCSVGCAAAVLSSTLVICTAPSSTFRMLASTCSTLALFSSMTSLVTPSRFICCLILEPPTSFAPPVMPVPAPVAETVPTVVTFFPLLNAIPGPPSAVPSWGWYHYYYYRWRCPPLAAPGRLARKHRCCCRRPSYRRRHLRYQLSHLAAQPHRIKNKMPTAQATARTGNAC